LPNYNFCNDDPILLQLSWLKNHTYDKDSFGTTNWYNTNKQFVTTGIDSIKLPTEGKYFVETIDSLGCTFLDSTFIKIYRPTFETFGDTIICPDENLEILAKSAEIGYYNMALYNKNSMVYFSGKDKSGIINYKVTEPLKVVIEFVQTEKDFTCSVFDSFNIDIHQLHSLEIQAPDAICLADTLTLTSAFDSIRWNLPFANKTGKSVDFVINDPKYNDRNLLVTVNAKDANNCLYDSTFTVFVRRLPRVDFSFEPNIFKDSTFSTINLCDTIPYAKYLWQIGDPIFKTYKGFEPKMSIDSLGKFPIKLVVTDSFFSCKNEMIKFIDIIPNSITKMPLTGLKLYPNPAQDLLTVHFQENTNSTIRIITLSGIVLTEFKSNSTKLEIPVYAYANGLYFIEIANKNMLKREMFQIIH